MSIVYLLIIVCIALSLRYHWWRMPISYDQPRVLMYHMINAPLPGEQKRNKWRVRAEDFERQMAWFSKNGWQSFTITEMVSSKNLPPKSFCLTFDDGYKDNFTDMFPILKRYGFKATIYLVPGYKSNSWEKFDNKMFDALLDKEEILEMQKSGLVEFGSHTLSHKNLLTIKEEEIKQEVMDSKKGVEEMIGCECSAFAYPYGKYNDKIVKLVKDAGYSSATIVKRGFFEESKPFEIKRVGILGTESFFDFYLKITRIRNKF